MFDPIFSRRSPPTPEPLSALLLVFKSRLARQLARALKLKLTTLSFNGRKFV
jgi:hypothetical protein